MPRFRKTVPVDDYVFDVLMRDLVGHDQQPGAFLVYLHLYRASERKNWRPVTRSLRAYRGRDGPVEKRGADGAAEAAAA